MHPDFNQIYKTELSDKEFSKLSSFIYQEYGIKLPPVKKIMLQSRLHKRLKALGMFSFKEYLEYVFSKKGQEEEVIQMMDVVSTNKTDFFREPTHFEYIQHSLLPQIGRNFSKINPLKIWSAACSSGEEAYTIAITMEEYMAQDQNFDYRILGTDISTKVLQTAYNATYPIDRIDIIPIQLKKKYFLKSKDIANPRVRLTPNIRKKVSFDRLNFMDSTYSIPGEFDIIFCRNVLIYFDKDTQEKVINKLCTKLKSNGIFFLGHSESLTGISAPLKQLKPTIFEKI